MAEQRGTTARQPGPGQVTFDGREVEALRTIVTDWIGEDLVVPPYPDAIRAVLEKLRIPDEAAEGLRRPTPLRRNQG